MQELILEEKNDVISRYEGNIPETSGQISSLPESKIK